MQSLGGGKAGLSGTWLKRSKADRSSSTCNWVPFDLHAKEPL